MVNDWESVCSPIVKVYWIVRLPATLKYAVFSFVEALNVKLLLVLSLACIVSW